MVPMKKWIVLACLFIAAGYVYSLKRSLPFLSFDSSMVKANPGFCVIYESDWAKQWKIVKTLYETHLCAKPSKEPRIPKVIHQIWIGGKLPEKYLPLQKSWKEHHPDWEYRLWTDDDLASFPFSNRERFEKAVNIGERADILRYEILNLYGGVYVDTDFECVRPLDPLNHLCDLYVGIFGAYAEAQEVNMGNGLIGAIPNHPIIRYCLERISEKSPGKTPDEVQDVSGPGCLRRAFFKCYRKGSLRNVACPCTFFYPLPSHERCGHLDDWNRAKWVEPETFGIHYWDVSWAK